MSGLNSGLKPNQRPVLVVPPHLNAMDLEQEGHLRRLQVHGGTWFAFFCQRVSGDGGYAGATDGRGTSSPKSVVPLWPESVAPSLPEDE